ncbi:fused FliR family export protein/FlhB family type III secretion system protein [Clostridium isatidis]|uniref:fused FliR family export protein/FlhB family type III secretion system protein n=1 Tax=Clostridium isatidis TaxID=182773 RepID=UPI003AABF489
MIDTAYFLALILVFLRIAAFLGISNVFFPTGTPNKLKVFVSLILSFSLLGGIDYTSVNEVTSNYYLIIYVISEILTGLIFGLIVDISFKIIIMAGSLIDLHIGLSMVNIIDPNSKVNTTLSGNLLHSIALMIFFIVDGHHLLIKSLLESFNLLPLGRSIIFGETMLAMIQIIVEYFIIGLKIAIPIVLIIILTDLCMGLISRAVPQINVMILGMPVKMLVGIIAIGLSLPVIIKIIISNISYIPEIIRKIITAVPFVFLIASDEKTEEATPKRKSDARKKGQVARSKDVGLAITFVASIFVIILLSNSTVEAFKKNIIYFLSQAASIQLTDGTLQGLSVFVLSKMATTLMPIILPIMIAGVAASLMQTGFLVVKDAIKPSLNKLNPISGFKNMFSKRSAIELVKNLVSISIIIFMAYSYVKDNFYKILNIGNLYLPTMGVEVKSLLLGIFYRIAIFVVVVAAIDYIVQVFMHRKEMRMSKEEVKEEYKQMEGDPQIKSKIKQKQREMSRRRMINSVGDATVVITNPTHLAVAIKYEEGKMEAPQVVAKGADLLALKIKEKARESDVPIIENKPLARMIYEQVEIDKFIPQDMYQAVAEILAMVYKLDKKKRAKG